jgi:LytS/YehU family sensor histidine kinase
MYQFSKYIRNNLEQKNYSKPIPFPEELDYIETYLALERVRFGDRINVEYDIKTREFWVLPLSIQPFVENAVKHGLFPSKNGGTVRITTRSYPTTTLIRIQDNGVGFNTADMPQILEEKKSVGMRSAMMRLEKEMGAVITVQSSTDPRCSGTCIDIEIPIKKGSSQ